ncbi:hypothetical protein LMH73_003630 [Vibrio splendidus]|nr:hypothetical protein [Vibrio splendidus]MCC4883327.1 hypothetical protein [Vibrio splendidus]
MKIIKKTALAIALSSSLMFSHTSHAGLPTIDFAGLTESVAGNIQSASQWVSESSLLTTMIAADSYFQQALISMDTFLAQFSMQKELKLNEELHNLMIKEAAEPDKQAPRNCAIQKVGNAVECFQVDTTVRKLDYDSAKHNNFTSTPIQVQEEQVKKAKSIISQCRANQYADNSKDTDELATSLCLRGGILTGAESGDAWSTEEQKAADLIVDLITGPIPESKASQALPEGSFEKDQVMVDEMRKLAIRSLAVSSIQHVASMRRSAGQTDSMQAPSELALLQAWSDERWGSPEWMVEVAGATKDQKDAIMPSEIQRRMAAMQAFQTHLEILKYKQQLRMEALQAASLMLQSEQLK